MDSTADIANERTVSMASHRSHRVGGEAVLYDADQLYASNQESLKIQFCELVDTEYREILAALKKKDCDLIALSKHFQSVRMRDYFNSELGQRLAVSAICW